MAEKVDGTGDMIGYIYRIDSPVMCWGLGASAPFDPAQFFTKYGDLTFDLKKAGLFVAGEDLRHNRIHGFWISHNHLVDVMVEKFGILTVSVQEMERKMK